MYTQFTEQQLEIRDLVRNFVRKEIPHEVALHWDEKMPILQNSLTKCVPNLESTV